MKSNNKKKVIILLFFISLIAAVMLILINKYDEFVDEKYGIETRIGEKSIGGDIGVYEYKVLIEKTIGPYLKALKDGEFETAYSYHTPEYNQYVSYDEFLNKVKDKNYDSYTVLNVVKITQNMYEIILNMADGNEHEFLVVVSEDKSTITPENFLLYSDVNESIEKKNVRYELKGYKVLLDKCIFYITIENKTNEEININSSKMVTTVGSTKVAENGKFVIAPKYKLDLEIEFDTSVSFPKTFMIEKKEKNKIRTYEFKL